MTQREVVLEFDDVEQMQRFCGPDNELVEFIEGRFNASILIRDQMAKVSSNQDVISKIEMVLVQLLAIVKKGVDPTKVDVQIIINQLDKPSKEVISVHPIAKNAQGKIIYPKTPNQQKYVKILKSKDIVFGIGPAGTGKTYLAVVHAIQALKNSEVEKIILTRPAVEAGEHLGFLPGDLKEKVDPYLRPLYDALYEMLGFEYANRLIEKNIIEIAPLAYMRGRTLEDAYIILDEAQNTTDAQMRMFLTRLGESSKMIITGDITQIDLPHHATSGLINASRILSHISEIAFTYFDATDVVRHPLVQKIIESYEGEEDV